ncbi:MAG: amidohydrolase family protein [Acidobacteriota bacterium]
MSHTAGAQQRPVTPPITGAAIAFVNVNVIPMDGPRLETGRTVVVQGERITAIGERGAVPIPDGAAIVDGSGRYLAPGLTDAHVHLEKDMPWAPTRPDFSDAPLYLAYGVTTVINLGGSPEQLDWRRRIADGELLGPTIYTAGAFIDEPRVKTPDEVAQEIAAQHRAGYDLIKFHPIFTRGRGYITTTGLSRESYLKMNDGARQMAMPLVGHAPVYLGLDVLLQARQPLAHLGMLSNIHFLPLASSRAWLLVTASALAALMVMVVTSGAAAIIRRWRRTMPPPSRSTSRVRALLGLQLLAAVLAVASAASFLPGGPLFQSVALRLILTFLILFMAAATVALVVSTAAIWRDPGATWVTRLHAALGSSASLAFMSAALVFWVPVAWRSSDAGIERLARRIHEAGIPVQTTLVAYDAIGGPGRQRLIDDPAIAYLRADTQAIWRRGAQAPGPPGYRYTDFMKTVAGALHRAGVPLMAGTDAMGAPLVAPGSSLHRELELLTESGLSPYEAMRAATVVPATFLAKEKEFGTIATGQRADLLLIDGNPLEDVTRLKLTRPCLRPPSM